MLSPDAERIAGGNANAAGQPNGLAKPLDLYIGDTVEDSLRNRTSGSRIRAAQDHHELLATVAPDDIRLAQLRLDRPDDGTEACVTGGMPKGIVDFLEVIEVDEQERYRQAAGSGARTGRIETFHDRAAVQHPGQRVDLRPPLCLRKRKTLLAQAVGHPKRNENRRRNHRKGQAVVQE